MENNINNTQTENTNTKYIPIDRFNSIVDGKDLEVKKMVLKKFVENGYTIQGFNDEGGIYTQSLKQVEEQNQPQQPRYGNFAKAIKDSLQSGRDTAERGFQKLENEETTGGKIATGAGILGKGIIDSIGVLTSPLSEIPGIKELGELINKGVDFSAEKLAPNNPEQQENIKYLLGGIAELIGAKGAPKAGAIVSKGAKAVGDVVLETGKGISKVVDDVIVDTVPTKNILKDNILVEKAKEFKKNFDINRESQKAKQIEIDSLPEGSIRNSAKSGIDVEDIKRLKELPQDTKSFVRDVLLEQVKKFSKGDSKVKTDPLDTVGEPITKAVRKAERVKKQLGKRLSDSVEQIADDLDSNTFISNSLTKAIPGIKIVDGKLNFSDTSLASQSFKGDRLAIVRAFKEVSNIKNAKKLDNYRKGLVEDLNLKNRKQEISSAGDKGLNAIKSGIIDTLSSASPNYRNTIQRYAKLSDSLEKGFIKKLDTEDVGLSNIKAGQFAKRLSSSGVSKADIYKEIKNLADNIGDRNLADNVIDLLDSYNIIGKYFDTAPATSFKGQVSGGIESSLSKSGIIDKVIGKVTNNFKNTPEVRQKAFEDLINQLIIDDNSIK